jgi:predicted phosphate transport protein (TIGR00153 family)
MLKWFHVLMPREERFFDMFEAHAKTLVAGSHALRRLLEGGEGVPGACDDIMRHEHEADAVARDVMLAVRRTFITPFDRGDIKDLISLLDDAIDQMQKTAKSIQLFEVREFEPQMREMGDIIVKCADLTLTAVTQLGEMRKNAASLNAIAEQVIQLEEQADGIHEQGLKALYQKCGRDHAMGFIVGREIYSHLEKVVDRFEDVANRINGVLVEHL